MTPAEIRGRLSAVLLDMDGTLVDSDEAVETAWSTWAGQHDLDQGEVLAFVHGREPVVTINHFLPGLPKPEIDRMAADLVALETGLVEGITATPGAHDFIVWMNENGLPWAVVTNATRELAGVRLQAAGIEPPLLVGLDELETGKPAPDGYLYAARQLGIDPTTALAVEDSEAGLTAAQSAGCMTATVRSLPGSDIVSPDLAELLATLSARA